MSTPTLEPYFTLRAYVTVALQIPSVTSGVSRLIATVTHGSIKGKDLEAEILPGGGDWMLVDENAQVGHLNVRGQARTLDNSGIYVHYRGILHVDAAAQKILSGDADARTTGFGEHVWFAMPRFETDSKEWKWIENEAWVGQGRWVVDGEGRAVEYRIFRVVN